jgi:hypothetical protein
MELAMAMFGVVILFLGCINTFIWIGRVLGYRQRYYDNSRPEAASVAPGSAADERQVDEDWLPRLHTLQ